MKIFEHVRRPKSRGVLSQTQEIGPILDKLTEVVLPHYLCDQKVTRQGNVSQIPPPCDVTKRDIASHSYDIMWHSSQAGNMRAWAWSHDVTCVMWCNSGDILKIVAWVTSRHACHITWQGPCSHITYPALCDAMSRFVTSQGGGICDTFPCLVTFWSQR